MRAVIQRVTNASVHIEDSLINSIDSGYMILLGVGQEDTIEDIEWISKKIANLRIFSDADGKMNLNIQQIEGEILLISQFTLYADTSRGNRPGFSEGAGPELGNKLYHEAAEELRKYNIPVKMGEFGADMQISLTNNGPVTILLDSDERKKKRK